MTPDQYTQVLEFVKHAQLAGATVNVNITLHTFTPDVIVEDPPDQGGDPISAVEAHIAGDKALARFIVGQNGNGYPILEIFPSDTSLASQRIRFAQGQPVYVLPDRVRADGMQYFFQLVETAPDGTPLYLRETDLEF